MRFAFEKVDASRNQYKIYDYCMYNVEFIGTFAECVLYMSDWEV